MRRIAICFLLAAATALCLAPATAPAAELPNYLQLKLGIYAPQANDVKDLDTGFNGEVVFGHYFHPNFAGELGIGYITTSGDSKDEFTGVVEGESDVTAYPVTANIKAVYPMGNVELYGLAGVGLYWVKVEFTEAGTGLSADDSDTAFGYQLGLGANYNVNPNFFIGLEGKYFWAKPSFGFAGEPEEDIKVDGIQATVNLGYRF